MTEPSAGFPDRLDSWKAIADHLGRDVRTVRRWEQKLGLPVRRVPGGRGHSVFAYVAEIDAWLKTTPPARQPDGVAEDPPVEVTEPTEVAERLRLLTAGRVWGVVGIGLLVAATAIAWRAHRPPVDMAALTIRVTPEAVVAMDSAGAEQWRYSFSPGETTGPLIARRGGPLTVLDDNAGVLVGVDARNRKSDATYLPGELLWFSPSGILRRTFSFSEPVTFGREHYRGWTISDYRVFDQRGRRQIAVSGRHFTWWPSFVTVLDENWRSRGTFFNAGWVEGLHWLSADRLLIAGFSNARDGGMVALLDTGALDGSSPAGDDVTYQCTSCGRATPVRYVVFPRSEINRASGSSFNRVQIEVAGDRIIARAVELPPEGAVTGAEVFYELTPSLDVIRGYYSDRYWELHRALEMEGKIHHTRDGCPGRDGPPAVEVWDAANGWRTVKLRK